MNIISWFLERLEDAGSTRGPASKPRNKPVAPLKRGPARAHVGSKNWAVVVARNTQPLYEERGWRATQEGLAGYYRTRRGSFRGFVRSPSGRQPEYLIVDPPAQLLNGPHGTCFRQRDKHVYAVHWNTRPDSVNTGILRIEHYLLEALS